MILVKIIHITGGLYTRRWPVALQQDMYYHPQVTDKWRQHDFLMEWTSEKLP